MSPAKGPMTNTKPVALITGASGGIGADLARIFARHGHDLALVARDGAKLEALADEIAAADRPRPLVIALDLTAAQAIAELQARIASENAAVAILVNNAGYGLIGNFAGNDAAGHLNVIDLNVRALVELTATFLPEVRAARGKILNVASTAAFAPGPGLAVYYATKAFVLSFSEALGQELRPEGVTVSALCPGPTATGFQARAGFSPGMAVGKLGTMAAMPVAQAGYDGLMAGKARIIPGLANKIMATMLGLTPHSLSLPIIAFLQKARGTKNA